MTIRKKDDVALCNKCGSERLHGDGVSSHKDKSKQKPRYRCRDCGYRSHKVKWVSTAPYEIAEEPPDQEMSLEDIISYRTKKFKKKQAFRDYHNLVNVNVKLTGPIGIAHFGDPHVDDDGTDLSEILNNVRLINETEGMFAGNLGDVQNNWVGRLASLYAQQSTTAKESWLLTEHFISSLDWLYIVGGNHDVWSGDGDPLEFMIRRTKAVYSNHGIRMNLNFPNKRKIRVNARHTFKGNSMWNTAHGVSRAVQMGFRDHIVTAGHIHVSGYNVLKDPSSGLISHALQVASFKRIDGYADKLGLHDSNIFNCPVTIINPKYEDNDNKLIQVILDLETACDYLKFLRNKK
mgnify:CR=1 FL=1